MSQASVQSRLRLPINLITPRDLAQLIREFETYDAALTAAAIQTRAAQVTVTQPSISELVQAFVGENNLQLSDPNVRSATIKALRQLRVQAPVFHLRFAAPIGVNEQQQLSRWFRQSVDEQALLDIGVQPAVIGGVYIRSKNQVFDLSWRQKFADSRHVLSDKLRELVA